MHLEILVEDKSGKALLDALMPRILSPDAHTWRIVSYNGIGRIPKGLRAVSDPAQRVLLDQLPRLLRGYASSLRSMQPNCAVVVVVDLDNRDCVQMKRDLVALARANAPHLRTLFRIAIEEIEAWMLGDSDAVVKAFPGADKSLLRQYRQDSICGTWGELRRRLPRSDAGQSKTSWAERIGPHMAVEKNRSPSFRVFRDGLRSLVQR